MIGQGLGDWWRWFPHHLPTPYVPTIQVIEKPSPSYDEHHAKAKADEGKPRVPFGFARALLEDDDA